MTWKIANSLDLKVEKELRFLIRGGKSFKEYGALEERAGKTGCSDWENVKK